MKRDVRIRPGTAKEAGLKPDVTIVVSDKVCACIRVPGRRAQDMVALALGKLNPQKAFLQGKIRVSPSRTHRAHASGQGQPHEGPEHEHGAEPRGREAVEAVDLLSLYLLLGVLAARHW